MYGVVKLRVYQALLRNLACIVTFRCTHGMGYAVIDKSLRRKLYCRFIDVWQMHEVLPVWNKTWEDGEEL